ncbi:MAG TPA: DUF4402 domain-containing protein [Chakrabartia sp.]|jgi:hypothetical protein|nr:DUF4402 domain-containing protein [Chakrabartia sp.]
MANTVTGTSTVTLVQPITVTNTQSLAFGSLIRPTAAGNVTINAQTAARTKSAAISWVGGSFQRGIFSVNGTPNKVVTLSMPNFTLLRAGGTQTMTVNTLRMSVNAGAQATITGTRNLGATGTLTIGIGGRVNVAANQMAGDYSGNYVLTVNYQ